MPSELPTPDDIEARAKAVNLTMPEVCLKADVAYTTFWRWKHGRTSPSMALCQRLLDAIEPDGDVT